MNEDDLQQAFRETDGQPINPQAKRRAIAAAMAEFASVQQEAAAEQKNNSTEHQGILAPSRLTATQAIHSENPTMTKLPHTSVTKLSANKKRPTRWLYRSAAAASVLFFTGYFALRSDYFAPRPAPVPASAIEYDTGLAVSQAPARETLTSKKELASAEALSKPAAPAEQVASGVALRAQAQMQVADAALSRNFSERAKMLPPPVNGGGMEEPIAQPQQNRERYEAHSMNPVKRVADDPVSTFSIDVDTASYTVVRRKLNSGLLPEKDAVRAEEFLNYFDYSYPAAADKTQPFATHVLVGDSPWKPGNKLIHIGIKGYEVKKKPRSNLVFLLDVSGSMAEADKLPLVKQSLNLLLDQLQPDDTVAIAVYAGAAGTVLEPTKAAEKNKIIEALNRLNAGGSTAGAQGIQLAYQLAEQHFDKEAVNRIILATDGDFNVGIAEPEKLKALVQHKRAQGIYLSVLGFGQGNYHDHMMQALAQNGNGIAAYIDTLSEAQKVLVTEATSALFPIANDVKIQIEFNPQTVAEYRLIGYETRQLNREDFNNDKVDAGDIGAGHSVTAIYEITPVNSPAKLIDDSRYQTVAVADKAKADEYALLKLRYKLPGERDSKLIEKIIPNKTTLDAASDWQAREYYFSAAVAAFAQLLKDDRYMENWNYDKVIDLALKHRGEDEFGYRNEFVQLVRKAKIAQH